jgi:hypothetical protein
MMGFRDIQGRLTVRNMAVFTKVLI